MAFHLYDKVEITLPNSSIATLTAPSGKTLTPVPIPLTDIEFSYDDMGYESVRAAGERLAVRFYPDECGTYTLLHDGTKQKIRVTRGKHHGYVETSRHDSRYFAFSDGTPYLPLGINLAFPTAYPRPDGGFGYMGMRQYEEWFRACVENGCTMARIWLGHEYLCPDTEEVGVFDSVQLAKIDALVDLARRYGLRLKLVIEQFRYFDYTRTANSDSYEDDVFRKFNKKLYKKGRRCESSAEWLSDPIWQDAWLCKMKKLAEHLSGDPTVFAIELWNEMNCMPRENRQEWNQKMLPAVKKLFPRHFVTNSLGSLDSDRVMEIYEEFCWDCSDLKEIHRYLDRGAKHEVCHDSLIDLARDGLDRVLDPGKPTLFSESGAVNNGHSGPFPHYLNDHEGILFCDAVYPPLFLGAADCGHIWHWDARYVESKNLYRLFRPLRSLFRGIMIDREDFRCETIEDDQTILLLLRGKNTTVGYLRNKAQCWQTILRDRKTVPPLTDKTISVAIDGNMKWIPIRKGDRVSYEKNRLILHCLGFGILLRWDR